MQCSGIVLRQEKQTWFLCEYSYSTATSMQLLIFQTKLSTLICFCILCQDIMSLVGKPYIHCRLWSSWFSASYYQVVTNISEEASASILRVPCFNIFSQHVQRQSKNNIQYLFNLNLPVLCYTMHTLKFIITCMHSLIDTVNSAY